MTVFGTLAIFVRNISLPSGELALYRAISAALLIGGYLLFSSDKLQFSYIKKELPLLLLSGAAMGINWILLFQAYNYTTVSAFSQGIQQSLAVFLSADLADHMDDGISDIQVRLDPVVLE